MRIKFPYPNKLAASENNMRFLKNIILIISITSTIQTFGCMCKDLGPLDLLRVISYNKSDFIFLGELIEFDTRYDTYTFRVIETFKGEHKDSFIKGKYFDSCSLFPRDKGKWIVYAEFREGLIDISQCFASRSELNPTCINCWYTPPPPLPPPYLVDYELYREESQKKFEKDVKLLQAKAHEDWEREIELLRQKRS